MALSIILSLIFAGFISGATYFLLPLSVSTLMLCCATTAVFCVSSIVVFFTFKRHFSKTEKSITTYGFFLAGAIGLACLLFSLVDLNLSRPYCTISVFPVQENRCVGDGELYLVNAFLDGQEIGLSSHYLCITPGAGWEYVEEWDDFKLSLSNLRESTASCLTVKVAKSSQLDLVFAESCYGGAAKIEGPNVKTQEITTYSDIDSAVAMYVSVSEKAEKSMIAQVVTLTGITCIIFVLSLLCFDLFALKRGSYKHAVENIDFSLGNFIPCLLFALALFCSVLLGCYFIPNQYDYSFPNLFIWCVFILGSVSSAITLNIIFSFLDTGRKSGINYKKEKRTIKTREIFLIIILCWLPYYLASFPGLVSPDTESSIQQAFGNWPLSNHHPIMFTLFIKLGFTISRFCGMNNTVGLAISTTIQMLVMAMVCVKAVCTIQDQSVPQWSVWLLIAFYSLCPLFGLYSVTLWKDILFSTFMLAFTLTIFEITQVDPSRPISRKTVCTFCLFGILLSFFRNNGPYIFYATSFIVYLMFKKSFQANRIMIVISVLLVYIIQGPVYNQLGITQSSFAESLGIPLQQIGYTVAHDDLTSEEALAVEQIMDIDVIKSVYTPSCVDSIKFNENFRSQWLNNNKKDFLEIWAKLLPNHLPSYIKGFLLVTNGYWNIYVTEKPWNAVPPAYYGEALLELDIHSIDLVERTIKYPLYEKWMESGYFVKVTAQFIPSITAMVLLLLWYLTYCLRFRKWEYVIVALPALILWGTTLIAAPISNEHRYVLSLYLIVPFLLALLISYEKRELL